MAETKTAPTPADRLAAAQAAEREARETLTALRERHKIGQTPVTAQEFGDAGHALELAALEREGAELAFAEAQRLERLEELAALAADIEANASVAALADPFRRAADAITELITLLRPRRGQIARWHGQLQACDVPPTPMRERPSPEDGGLGWRDLHMGGQVVLRTGEDGTVRAARALDVAQVFDGIVVRGCRQAGESPHLLNHTNSSPPGLAEDPERWFESH